MTGILRAVSLAAVAAVSLAACGATGQHLGKPQAATASKPQAAATIRCGLITCSHGHVGQPCSIAGYPGIIVQTSPTSLGCDPSPAAEPPAASSTTPEPSVTATCLMGYVNISAGSGEPVSSKRFLLTAPKPDTADGYSLAAYEAMQVTVGAAQTTSVGTLTIVWYDASGNEISSGTAEIGQVITSGQHLTFLYDESAGSEPSPPAGAATCQVVSWSQS